MRILLTNDDGIEAEGLRHLVDWARGLGEVCIFAPKTQQSAKSRSIQIHGDGFEVKKVDLFGGIEAYSVDSTPADCVRVAILGMKKQFDLAISGVNNGPNLGADIHYSGTVAACFEAAQQGTRAMAVSAAFNSFENAVKNLPRVYEEIGRRILITRMGPAIYSDDFDFLPDGTVKPRLVSLYDGTADFALDTDATMSGYITITPLSNDLTDFSAFERIKKKVG